MGSRDQSEHRSLSPDSRLPIPEAFHAPKHPPKKKAPLPAPSSLTSYQNVTLQLLM